MAAAQLGLFPEDWPVVVPSGRLVSNELATQGHWRKQAMTRPTINDIAVAGF